MALIYSANLTGCDSQTLGIWINNDSEELGRQKNSSQ